VSINRVNFLAEYTVETDYGRMTFLIGTATYGIGSSSRKEAHSFLVMTGDGETSGISDELQFERRI
jgi:hypothetical protein